MAVAAGNLGRPAHVDRNRWRLYCVVIIDGEPPASRPVSQAPVMDHDAPDQPDRRAQR
jgi:hypothetical protein